MRPNNEKKTGVWTIETPFEKFLRLLIFGGIFLILFTPLLVNKKYFFPFVAPKSIFFLAISEIIFFCWLILIICSKKYRPKFNLVIFSLILFLIFSIISSFLGIDFSRSFWSKSERMTGLLLLFHLFAFFLVVLSVARRETDWKMIFAVSLFVCLIISFIALSDRFNFLFHPEPNYPDSFSKFGEFLNKLSFSYNPNTQSFHMSDRGGSTLGNTSFFGTYVLFNLFFAIWLFLKSKKLPLKIYSLISFIFIVLTLFIANPGSARAAKLSFLGGLSLVFLLYLAFRSQKEGIRILGRALLIGALIIVSTAFYLFPKEGNKVNEIFVKMATKSRLISAEVALNAVKEKPLFGWGPENYEIAFVKHFNPKMYLREYGGEVWFDRAHNIIWDTFVATGIFGFLSYLFIFFSVFYFLFKKYFKGRIDFWTAAIFPSLLVAYFVQNLTVFDMVSSYLMFFLVLGFVSSLKDKSNEQSQDKGLNLGKAFLVFLIFLVFIVCFIKFISQPIKANKSLIEGINSNPLDSDGRLELFNKTLEIELGKYQNRDYMATHIFSIIQNYSSQMKEENLKEELGFIINELEKTKKQSPSDCQSLLRLGEGYMQYFLFFADEEKLKSAEEVFTEFAILSPNHPIVYWKLTQIELFKQDSNKALELAQKAVALEPGILNSHLVLIQVAKIIGDENLLEEKIVQAIKVNPEWEEEIKKQIAP